MPTTEQYQEFLESSGVEPSEENIAQMEVFVGAIKIFASRNAAYGSVWKQYGALSNLLSVARKVDRLMHSWWHGGTAPAIHKDALDDAYDLLNYCVFFIRNARNGNFTGTAPERPVDELAGRRGQAQA